MTTSVKRIGGEYEKFLSNARARSDERVQLLHKLARKIWKEKRWTALDLQAKCSEAWEELSRELGTRVLPLVPVKKDRPITGVIFGSGGFTTGEFQAAQYKLVESYAPNPPTTLLGLVTNRSEAHGCGASRASRRFNLPLVELDFSDWYHENVDCKETKPIQATRYLYSKEDPNRPDVQELSRRFSIRQEFFHKELGEKIAETFSHPLDIASARGYSFQLCSSIFKHQEKLPHANDTHPADLTYVDAETCQRKYTGWQAAPIKRMLIAGHRLVRGSLIEVEYMDSFDQIDKLDEGALLAIGEGVEKPAFPVEEDMIQEALKLVDDYVFCTLEPTGLILAWGITEDPIPVTFQNDEGDPIVLKQRSIVVGNKVRSGIHAWGRNLEKDLKELEDFLFDNRDGF
ncbi:hypothetical protein KEJ47_04415 [Candidatus Bathyarchaeota archaeon]|nr:hypothetical protein [Candidatus Bathyarchaeota archaeon]